MRRLLWLAVGLAALGAGCLYAGSNGLVKRTVWIVPHDHQGELRVGTGDVIEVWTRPLAVIPDNLESRFKASSVGRAVDLVGEGLPHKEGTMERIYFFKAFEPGSATLKVELTGADGQVRETRTYEVEVSAPSAE